jgi:hypothetical protein
MSPLTSLSLKKYVKGFYDSSEGSDDRLGEGIGFSDRG